MKCPWCADGEKRRRIGELWNRPLVVYHFEACEFLYATSGGDAVDDEVLPDSPVMPDE
jgi:hypothetical protein